MHSGRYDGSRRDDYFQGLIDSNVTPSTPVLPDLPGRAGAVCLTSGYYRKPLLFIPYAYK